MLKGAPLESLSHRPSPAAKLDVLHLIESELDAEQDPRGDFLQILHDAAEVGDPSHPRQGELHLHTRSGSKSERQLCQHDAAAALAYILQETAQKSCTGRINHIRGLYQDHRFIGGHAHVFSQMKLLDGLRKREEQQRDGERLRLPHLAAIADEFSFVD